jgi:hypothetical protein
MRWFKCPSLSSPEVIEAKKSIGFDGVMQCLMTIEEAFQWGVDELDEHLVSRWAKVKLDRARRILPFAQKIYQKSTQNLTKISSKSTQNLTKISSKSTQNLGDFTPSNPRGCNKSIERIERENRIEIEKEKEKKENDAVTPPKGQPILTKAMQAEFEQFYQPYPRKDDPGAAKKAFKTARERASLEEIVAGVKRYAEYCRKKQTERVYIKTPARFLNADAWASDYGEPFTHTKPVFKPATAYQSLFPPHDVYTLDAWEVAEDCHFGNPGIRNRGAPLWTIPLAELKPIDEVPSGSIKTAV